MDRSNNLVLVLIDRSGVTGTFPGSRPKEPGYGKPANPFIGTRLRVVFALLLKEDAVNCTYREIADLAGVALGTVGQTFKDLKTLGYLREYKHKRKIMNRVKLVNKWLEAYPTEVRPKLHPRRFTVPDRNWWIQADLGRFGAVLGGEVAAAVLTKHLHPERGVLYIPGSLHELAIALKLRADPEGNLTVMDRFWKGDVLPTHQTPIAPPLLLCEEALGTPVGRATNDLDVAVCVESLAVRILLNGQLEVKSAGFAEQFVLKLFAWRDRRLFRGVDDASDLAYFLRNALQSISEDYLYRRYDAVLQETEYDIDLASCFALGRRIASVFSRRNAEKVFDILSSELQDGDESALISDSTCL